MGQGVAMVPRIYVENELNRGSPYGTLAAIRTTEQKILFGKTR